MTLVSSFFSDGDDCKSFSQLLAGGSFCWFELVSSEKRTNCRRRPRRYQRRRFPVEAEQAAWLDCCAIADVRRHVCLTRPGCFRLARDPLE